MADIEEIRKKIDRLISENGLNYRDVSLKIGRKDSYIQQYVKYRYPRRLKEIDRIRLAKLLGVDDAEIMDDEVIATKSIGTSTGKLDVISELIKASCSPESALVSLEVLNPKLSEKDSSFADKPLGRHLVCKSILEDLTIAEPENIKIVKITNESMAPTINAGDIVWFDSSYTHPEADGLYLIGSGRELLARRIQISPLDGTVTISTDNAAYQSYQAPKGKAPKTLGKIVCVTRKV